MTATGDQQNDWECWTENLRVTKNFLVKGPWADCPMPQGAECQLEISDVQGFFSEGRLTIITGEADCQEHRVLDRVLITMVPGEKSEVKIFKDGVEQGKATIELLDMKNAEPIYAWQEEQIQEVVRKLKDNAVTLFKVKRTEDAFHIFSKAHSLLVIGEVKDSTDLKATLCSNMAACQLQQKNFSHAKNLSLMALELSPDMPKALYRLACSSVELKEYNTAESSLKVLLKDDPNNKDAIKLLCRLKELTQDSDTNYKNMVQRMFSL
ncbi:uncharacterized protein LOC132196982 [Neocloeon triangulifer]|uniref:uncharacterized protein LOC132196982 n=1 Tax=Neocloeon triangulifer TaxID=2078957 RepID=UPI00286F9F40|nr:uncharacterized protein LOC132196982 [Neocloeon triangulifer]XP_059475959.1 uncharacterized protein LOC132196982 [Neocloeon triangulifer]XP_059475960.1 uncharacterized protein LOC132196982 [Neocloeon triangulifer]